MSMYAIKDSTLTTLGDAVRSKVLGTTELIYTHPEKVFNYTTLVVIELPSFVKKAKIVGRGYYEKNWGEGWSHSYQGVGIALGEYTSRTNVYKAEDYHKLVESSFGIYPGEVEFEEIIDGNIFTLIGSVNASDAESIVITFDAIYLDENGNEFKYTPLEMADAINELMTIPEEAFTITGNCDYKFSRNNWSWFLKNAGDKITTENITNISYMFYLSGGLEEIPFDINMDPSSSNSAYDVFSECYKLTNIPMINNFKVTASGASRLFKGCYNIRNFPEGFGNNWDFSSMKPSTYGGMVGLFYNCYSLRKVPEAIIRNCCSKSTSSSSISYRELFYNCHSLDEINGLEVSEAAYTSNAFNNTFTSCGRLANLTFAVNEDGTPKTANWKNQTISLNAAGAGDPNYILNYNSGITADKYVSDDATYQTLKNDPDWYSNKWDYSRYNHDSAVNTINSLPDCSATGTNTIKFSGASGALTDGGAINTLTEEEIAVATAKGWTVSLV